MSRSDIYNWLILAKDQQQEFDVSKRTLEESAEGICELNVILLFNSIFRLEIMKPKPFRFLRGLTFLRLLGTIDT